MDLKHALARKSPDPGFADRVMARIEAPETAPQRNRSHWWRAVAATLLLTALGGGWAAHEAIERREGERARDEVLLALHIAGAKVRTAQQHVREIGSH
jgi:hypothetical protein